MACDSRLALISRPAGAPPWAVWAVWAVSPPFLPFSRIARFWPFFFFLFFWPQPKNAGNASQRQCAPSPPAAQVAKKGSFPHEDFRCSRLPVIGQHGDGTCLPNNKHLGKVRLSIRHGLPYVHTSMRTDLHSRVYST